MKVDIGRVFSNTFKMAREQAGSLLGLWAAFAAIQVAAIALLFVIVGGAAFASFSLDDPDPLAALGIGAGVIILFIALYFGYLVLYCIQSAAMAMSGSPITRSNFRDALSGGFRAGLVLFLVMVLAFVGYFIGSMVLGVLQLALSFLGGFGDFVISLIGFAGFVYVACRFAIITPIIAVDREHNPINAIRRSWALTDGNVVPIFVILLIVGVAALAVGGVGILMIGGVMFASAAASGSGAVGVIAVFGSYLVFSGVAAILGATLVSSIHAEVSVSQAEELSETFA